MSQSPSPSRSRRSVWTRRLVIAAVVAVAAQQAWRHGHDYVFPEQFASVEPGRIYRGAWQQTWPMKRIVRDHHIKTIVALAHPDEHPLVVKEKALADELGCRLIHIPIIDDRTDADPGDLYDRLEEAAAAVADPDNQPVYFHCHHGVNRASMVQMAYRTIYCGWTLDQATEEISRTFGLKKVDRGPDYRYMNDFYVRRVLPLRQARSASKAEAAAMSLMKR